MKKPGLGRAEVTEPFIERIAMCVEIMMGRRGRKVAKIERLAAAEVIGAAPTGADHNALVRDVRLLTERLNQLLEQVQDHGV